MTPLFETAIDRLAARLEERLGGPRFAMLVVPDFWGQAPLANAPAFRAKLRRWSERGVEMILHGWAHRDDLHHRTALAAFKARHLTAREGEFLGLDRAEAALRIGEGRAVLEDTIGAPVRGFIAPAWLYGPGARAALREADFDFAEDHWRVWRPADGAVVGRGPVVTWASRTRLRRASSLAFATAARRLLGPLDTVRIALHPGDASAPAILRSFDMTLAALRAGRRPGAYRELAAAAPLPEK